MDERKKREFESLRQKYFWEQKFKEIGLYGGGFLLILLLVTTLLLLLGHAVEKIAPGIICGDGNDGIVPSGIFYNTQEKYCMFTGSYWEYVAVGMMGLLHIILFGIALLDLILIVYYILATWIHSNWKRAEYRAKKDLGLIRKDDEDTIDFFYNNRRGYM
jgi:hypothetical protein